MNDSVLIVGVGDGLSASLARLFSNQNMNVLLASRNIDKLSFRTNLYFNSQKCFNWSFCLTIF